MDEYHISELPQRYLMTQHYQSSMDQPNLDNVQAKLNVARQRNHQLAVQFFRNKYGSAIAYEQFTKTHNMGEIVNQMQPSPQQLLIKHLERKAKEIQNKFYNQEPFQQQNNEEHESAPAWARKKNKKAADSNPWVKQQKILDKHRKNQSQSQKYIDSAIAPKNKESQFISQFKHFLNNKQKKQLQKKKQQNFNQSSFKRTSESKLYSPSKMMNKSLNKSFNEQKNPNKNQNEKKKCYEQQLAKKIYKDITGQCRDQVKVEKLALVQYIVQNKKILKVLGFTQAQLNNKLLRQYTTKSETQITMQEFVFFILKSVGKQKQINQLKQQRRSKDVPQGCLLSKQIIVHFEKVFKQMDTHTDLIIKRLPYIDRLANDPFIRNQLNSPAVLQPDLSKSITLRRIFQRIQMQCIFGSQEQQKVKQYISWNQFLDYFKSGYSSQSTYNMVLLIDSLHKSQAMGLIEVPDIVIQIITNVIPKVSLKAGNFNTLSLIQQIAKHPQFQHQKYTQVRQQSRIAGLPSQTFEQVLSRIKKNAQKYISLKEFLEFFSAKGRPIQQYQLSKINASKKNFSGVKIKFVEDQIINKQQNLDGYDSDPQIYQSKVMNKNSGRKSGRSAKKIEQTNSFMQEPKNIPSSRMQFKVTIPVPFNFQERQKQRAKNKVENIKQNQEQLQHFKAKPVPQKVLDRGLYERMLEDQKRKIQQRRKGCMIMTLANEQPFSFLNRKTNKKTKQERQQFIFQAKPIPWYCSVNLLEKKKEAQILRNEKIAKQAQQNLAKAKLPPRMQRDFQQKQAKLALAENQKSQRIQSKQKLYREPPDFDRLHRQFQEGLQRKRKQNKSTIPQQFNLSNKTGSRPKTSYQNQTQQFVTQKQFNKTKQDFRKIFQSKPVAASTAKFDQQVQKRRQQLQKKRKQEEQKKLQDQKRRKIDEELKQKLIVATKNKQNKQKQKQQQKRENQMKEQMKNFQQWKKTCIQKGRNQPMLVQRPLKRDQKIQKMKKLYQISQTLKKNGIKGKQHDTYFKREQLLMLQDWEILKDKL